MERSPVSLLKYEVTIRSQKGTMKTARASSTTRRNRPGRHPVRLVDHRRGGRRIAVRVPSPAMVLLTLSSEHALIGLRRRPAFLDQPPKAPPTASPAPPRGRTA